MNKEGAVGLGELCCSSASGSALLGSRMGGAPRCHFVGVMRWVLNMERELEQPEAELLEEATLGVGVLWEFPAGPGSGCVQPRSRRKHCVPTVLWGCPQPPQVEDRVHGHCAVEGVQDIPHLAVKISCSGLVPLKLHRTA